MDLTFEALDLKLHFPFTISRGTQIYARNVQVSLGDGHQTGTGEAAPSEHYGEMQGTVLAFLKQLQNHLAEAELVPITTLHTIMDDIAHLNPAAKAAVDMAAYDLLGKRLGAPIYELLGLDPAATPRTSFTIGIDTPDIMARKAADAAEYPILKVKVGTPDDEENLAAIRTQRPEVIIRVDANEAWSPKQAIERIEALTPFGIEFVEQPVPARDLEGLGYVRDAVSIPIITDESCIVPEDVPRVAPYVDGINIKIMKCGGLYPALKMIHLARAHHLSIMMGCMIESSIAITAAAHLSPLIDYADLDGNLLIDADPFRGVTVEDGKLILPTAPGLGLQPAS
jgi:L-Ala-D/L-Glu epimerase